MASSRGKASEVSSVQKSKLEHREKKIKTKMKKKYEILTSLPEGFEPMFPKVFIYTLRHPVTKSIRYVGKASNVRARYSRHLWSSRNPQDHEYNYPVYRWIRKIGNNDLLPEMFVFELTTESAFKAREKYWIAYYRERGIKLLNIVDGGEGWANGRKHKKKSKLKMSISAKKRIYPGWQSKMTAARIGHEVKETTRIKLSKLFKGRKMNHETGEQISKRQKKLWDNLTPEQRRIRLTQLAEARKNIRRL